MPEVRMQDVQALGDLLVALDKAGVSLQLGFKPGDLRPAIASLGDELRRRVNRGESLHEALKRPEVAAPAGYQRLIAEWIDGVALSEALENARVGPERSEAFRSRLTLGLLYPALVAVLACLGLAATCRYLLPIFEATYADLREPVGSAVAWLQAARATTFVWLLVVPLLIVVGVLWLRRGLSLQVTRNRRPLGVESRDRLAIASDAAATVLDAGASRDEALTVAGLAPHGGDQRSMRLPPLLTWAANASTGGTAAAGDFRAVGEVYHDLAKRGSDRVAIYAPLFACVVVAGGATLLYGLALFLPIVELLFTLSY